jgi:hypothetical protein
MKEQIPTPAHGSWGQTEEDRYNEHVAKTWNENPEGAKAQLAAAEASGRFSHEAEADSDRTYEDMSLSELAARAGEAEAHGDISTSTEIQSVAESIIDAKLNPKLNDEQRAYHRELLTNNFLNNVIESQQAASGVSESRNEFSTTFSPETKSRSPEANRDKALVEVIEAAEEQAASAERKAQAAEKEAAEAKEAAERAERAAAEARAEADKANEKADTLKEEVAEVARQVSRVVDAQAAAVEAPAGQPHRMSNEWQQANGDIKELLGVLPAIETVKDDEGKFSHQEDPLTPEVLATVREKQDELRVESEAVKALQEELKAEGTSDERRAEINQEIANRKDNVAELIGLKTPEAIEEGLTPEEKVKLEEQAEALDKQIENRQERIDHAEAVGVFGKAADSPEALAAIEKLQAEKSDLEAQREEVEKQLNPEEIQAESERLAAEGEAQEASVRQGLEAGLAKIDEEIAAIEANADLSDEEKAAQLEEKQAIRAQILESIDQLASPAEAGEESEVEAEESSAEKENSTAPSLDGLPARAEVVPDPTDSEATKKSWFKRVSSKLWKLNPLYWKVRFDETIGGAKSEAEDAMVGEYKQAIATTTARKESFEEAVRMELGPDADEFDVAAAVKKREKQFHKDIGNTGWNHVKNLAREVRHKVDRGDYESDEQYEEAKSHKRKVILGAVAIGAPLVIAGTFVGMRAAGVFEHMGTDGVEPQVDMGGDHEQQADLGSLEARNEDADRVDGAESAPDSQPEADGPIPGEYTADNINVNYEEYLSTEKVSNWAMGTRMDMTSTGTAMDAMWSLGEDDPAHATQMAVGFLTDDQARELGLENMTPQQIEEAMHDDELRAASLNMIAESLESGDAKVDIVDDVYGNFHNWGAAPVDADGNIISMEEARENGISDTELTQESRYLAGVSLLRVTDSDGNISYFNSECKNFLTEEPTPEITIIESDPVAENPSDEAEENPSDPDAENPSDPEDENPSDPVDENPSDPVDENPSDEIEENPKTEDPGEYPSEPDAENPSDEAEENPSDEAEENPSDPDAENPSDPEEENPSDEIEENPKSDDPDDYPHDPDAPEAEVDPEEGETEPPVDTPEEDTATAEEEPGDEVPSDHDAGTADDADPVDEETREEEVNDAPVDDSAPQEEDPGTEVEGPAAPPAPVPAPEPAPAPVVEAPAPAPAPVVEAPAPEPAPAPEMDTGETVAPEDE